MKKYSLKALILCSLFSVFSLNAQEDTENGEGANNAVEHGVKGPEGYVRCLTAEYNESLSEQGLKENKEEFEEWLAPKLAAHKAARLSGAANDDDIITIPVVIHVIHNGDAVNTNGNPNNENISYAQAISQIDVLNQDFRRIAGTLGAGTSGYNLGVDVEVQFCLAEEDPDGNPTDGVNRVDMGQASWEYSENNNEIDDVVKPNTIWDPTKYMNMWSVKFSTSGTLGYAQFPSASTLNGLPVNAGPEYTDGVVSNYNVFGTIDQNDGSFVLNNTYNRGRTMTHEVGHWLGLRHIWGDSSGCSDGSNSGDFVSDTPASSGPNYSCQQVSSCGSIDMVENYMDYTNDSCMDTFTQGQKDRILTVLANSPRRMELVNSTVCSLSPDFDIDGAINVIDVGTPSCSNTITPTVEIVNNGNNTLTSGTIVYSMEGLSGPSTTETYDWTGSLETYQTEIVTLPSLTLESGPYTFEAELTNVNNDTDEEQGNNLSTIETFVTGNFETSTIDLELVPDFYGSQITWTFSDSSGNVLYDGGPYGNFNTSPINAEFTVNNDECYTFTIYDEAGDGICCENGQGYFELTADDGTVIYDGASFEEDVLEVEMSVTNDGMSVEENVFAKGISLYPNPSTSVINVSVENNELPTSVKVYNMVGQMISQKNIETSSDLTVDISSYSNGVYFMKIEKDGNAAVKRFIKE